MVSVISEGQTVRLSVEKNSLAAEAIYFVCAYIDSATQLLRT